MVNSKQIMIGLKGNRQSCPRDSATSAQEVNRNFFEAILSLKGQIDILLPEGPVIIFIIIPLCLSKKKMIILIGSFLALPWV